MAGRLHRQKPDKDNVLKAICDALNGLVWVDDAQAAIQRIEMRWGDRSQFRVTVREVEPA
jgi:Holliday junction resolvase RusA-like endonuclease